MNDFIKKLSEFSGRNIRLWTEDGKLRFKAAAGVLTSEDKEFLKANKEEIITYLLNDEIKIETDTEHQYEPFGMTEIQQAYVLGRNPAFEYGGIACHIYMELEYDELDPIKVQYVWNALIKRHHMLRAVMSVDGYQQIMPETPQFEVKVVSCTENDADEKRAAIKSELDHKIYDPEKWPLYSVVVSKGIDKDIMHFSIEFVTADWSSIWTVLSEFESLYFHPEKTLLPIEITFRDYLIAEKKLRQGSQYYRDKEYWTNRIDTLPPAPELPLLDIKSSENVRFERNQFSISKKRWDNFCKTAKKFGVTPTSAVMTAYGMVIGRWSKNKSFCLNLSILNRLELHPQIGTVVGDFTASSLLEMEHKAGYSFKDIALQINRQLFDDLDHRLFTGVNVLREIQQRKKAAIMPYVFTGAIGLISPEKSNLIGKMNNNGISQTPQVFMDCQAMDTIEGLNINIDSRTGVFPDGVVNDICNTLHNLLISLSENENSWTANPFSIDLPEWQTKKRIEVNNTYTKQNKYLLHQKVLKQLNAFPESFAVADSQTSWTCAELYENIKKVSAALKNMNVGRGDFVAVTLPKSRWQIAACLGILASGAAYVPLDVNGALNRSEAILKKISAKCVIQLSENHFNISGQYHTLDIDRLESVSDEDLVQNSTENEPYDIAYIIFTSGSTGEPKGVAMSHSAAVNTIEAINRMFDINRNDRIFNLSQLNFDLSVYDIFGVLSEGGGIVIPDHKQYKNPSHWVEMINRYKVTVWNSVPALMQLLLIYRSYNENTNINPLRLVLLSGDWIPNEQPDKLKELFPNVKVISLGGATEGGIWSVYHECDSEYDNSPLWKSIPYGKPLPNQGFMILDSLYQDCPVWVQGELLITGDSLASSYLNEPVMTENSFIDINGIRAYKTGDMGCYHPDGTIEFLGRSDNQVKLRGHRIELGEVEAIIRKQMDIENISCVVYEVKGEKKIVAVIAGNIQIDEKTLKEKLEPWLPEYMIPVLCITTDTIPLTANGKVDRKAILSVVERYVQENKKAPVAEKAMSETEKAVIDIMSEVLNNKNLEPDDNFYEAGANSLILARVAGMLNQNVESSIPFDSYLIQMLNIPTAKALAEFIDEKRVQLVEANDDTAVLNEFAWKKSEGNTSLCVVFTNGLKDDIIEICRKSENKNYLFVTERFIITELIEMILNENLNNLTFLTSDYELVNCIKTASFVMENGIVPECVNIIETELESEFAPDTLYMGNVRFGLTVSDATDSEDIKGILEEFCIGDIEIADCRTNELLIKFID